MMKQPLVSVIIPLYNSENYISETIESVLNQTYKNIEVVVVDDGSTDDSLSIAKRYESNNLHVYHQENSGAPVARNFGFRMSKGSFIQYLDADDKLTPNKIEKQVAALGKGNSYAIATSSVFVMSGEEEYLWDMPEIYHDYERGFDLLVDLWRFFIPSWCIGSYLVPRNLVLESGGWDETLKKNQDGEFFSRVLVRANKVVFIETEGQIWRLLPTSMSHSIGEAKIESVYRSYRKISDLMLSVEDSKRVRQAVAAAYGSFVINDSDRKYADLALKRLNELHIKPNYRIQSKYFRMLVPFLHPQTAFSLFKKIQRYRGRDVYFSNNSK